MKDSLHLHLVPDASDAFDNDNAWSEDWLQLSEDLPELLSSMDIWGLSKRAICSCDGCLSLRIWVDGKFVAKAPLLRIIQSVLKPAPQLTIAGLGLHRPGKNMDGENPEKQVKHIAVLCSVLETGFDLLSFAPSPTGAPLFMSMLASTARGSDLSPVSAAASLQPGFKGDKIFQGEHRFQVLNKFILLQVASCGKPA